MYYTPLPGTELNNPKSFYGCLTCCDKNCTAFNTNGLDSVLDDTTKLNLLALSAQCVDEDVHSVDRWTHTQTHTT